MRKDKLSSRLKSYLRPLRSIFKATRRTEEGAAKEMTGLTAGTETHPEDVFIVSYPKSGNTWFRYLATGAYYGVNPEYAPHALIKSLIPDLHATRQYLRYQTPMFFKSHALPEPAFRRVVYLVRDGRDVMVSYFRHRTDLDGEDVDFLRMAKTGEGLVFGKWHEHVDAWMANPFNAQMMVIKYEDLKHDAVRELLRFCKFMGIKRDEKFLKLVAEGASFEIMRRKEKRDGWDDEVRPEHQHFVRRGQIGSYKDEMPSEVLEAFLREAGPTLERCRYLSGEGQKSG